MLLPVPHPFTGTRPEIGGQAAQQFQHGGLQRHSTIQSLQHQQPEHNQSRVEAIVAADAGFLLGLLQEIERQKVLKQRQNPAQGILINDRRERECWSCLKLGYRSMKIQASDFRPHSENSATPVMPIKNYVALGKIARPTPQNKGRAVSTAGSST